MATILALTMPDDPNLDGPPTPLEREQAKAHMLCERADLLDKLDESDQQTALKFMDDPTYLELQADESRLVQTIADDAATLLYGRTLDQCPLDLRVLLRFNAAIFLRLMSNAWQKYAREQAIEVTHQKLVDELGKALPPAAVHGLRGLAARIAPLAIGVAKDALGANGISPGAYLRAQGHAIAERAQRQAERRR